MVAFSSGRHLVFFPGSGSAFPFLQGGRRSSILYVVDSLDCCLWHFHELLLTVAGSLNRGSGVPISGAMLMPVVLNIGSFFAIAWLGGFLASKLSETERLLKEKRIDYQELEALKETLLQGVGSGVAITDTQGRINYFNGPAQHLTSLQEATVKGKKLDQIFPGLTYNFDGRQETRRVI